MSEAAPRSAVPGGLKVAAAVALLLALHVGFLWHAAAAVAWTADEPNYLGAGHALWTDFGFTTRVERLHGPLPFLANHLFVDATQPIDLSAARLPARLGMLPFALLLLFAVAGWSHELYGRCGMLLSLAVAALSPALLGYGALIAVDTALASTSTLALWLLWRHAQRPTLLRAAACGTAVGVALATKFLAVLIVPCVAFAVAIAGWRAARLRGACYALAVVAVTALVALHACHGFAVPRFTALDELASSTFQRLAALPLAPSLLGLLPDPFVRGIDFQLVAAGSYEGRFLDREGGHPLYYVVTLLTKLPLPTLVLFVLACVVRVPRGRGLGLTLALPAAGMLAYLSASRMQLGMRYVLPLLPLLHVFIGRVAASPLGATRAGALVLALLPTVLLVERAVDAPHHLSYFNPLVGRRGGMDLFADSNCDWGQDRDAGQRALASRQPGTEFLAHDDGPRFGRVARHVFGRKRSDPLRPGRTYDWLARFEPVDRYLAAWLVYEVDADDFRAAIRAGDARAAVELVLAFVQADDAAGARDALAGLREGPERDRLAALLDALEVARAAPDDSAALLSVLPQLAAFRLFGPAARLAERLPVAHRALLWQLLWEAGRMPELIDRLAQERRTRTLGTDERFVLAQAHYWRGDFDAAIAELEAQDPPASGSPLRAAWDELRARAVPEARQLRRMFGR